MTETITIERMGSGAEAVGHLTSGKAVFVEGAAPGDIVEVEVVEEKASFARARLVRVCEASDAHAQLNEPVSNLAGCTWAQLTYAAQLQAKRANVVSALQRTAHFDAAVAEDVVAPCVSSKREWGYRNKIELGVRTHGGPFTLGFYREGSHDIEPCQLAPLAVKPLQKAPKALQGCLRFIQGADDLGIFRVGVRSSLRTHDLEIALWTTPGAFPRAHVAKTLKSALKATSIVRVVADPGKARKVKTVEVLDGKGAWEEELCGLRYLTSAPSFFQVNTAQAEKLMHEVIAGLAAVSATGTYEGVSSYSGSDEWGASAEAKRSRKALSGLLIADLYAGGGTFSLPLARAGADVIAVEAAGSSVRDLRRNADRNQVAVEVIGGDAARELPELGGLDALVVDPPRAGLADGVVQSIAAAHPKAVAYVSCNPQTLARDIERFEQEGYRLIRVTPVDLFPQTHHVELIALLSNV